MTKKTQDKIKEDLGGTKENFFSGDYSRGGGIFLLWNPNKKTVRFLNKKKFKKSLIFRNRHSLHCFFCTSTHIRILSETQLKKGTIILSLALTAHLDAD
jgi:hypothetical protein